MWYSSVAMYYKIKRRRRSLFYGLCPKNLTKQIEEYIGTKIFKQNISQNKNKTNYSN